MYATHTYTLEFDVEPTPASDDQTARNVQVTGPAGALRKVSLGEGQVVVAPQAAGTLPLTISWDQRGPWDRRDLEPSPWCSASTTVDVQVHEPVPIGIEPWSRGKSGLFESFRRNGFAIVFKLAPGALPRYEYFPDPVDLTPVRVEARAVAGAKRPGSAVEPAVLEHVPGAKPPRRAQRGLVTIVRREGGTEWGILPKDDGRETIEIFVATPPGVTRRGVSVTLTQGPRRLGSFAAAGRCYTKPKRGPYYSPSTTCDFKDKHAWLSARCRPILVKGRFRGCSDGRPRGKAEQER
jgi:hypothetical protein